MNAHSANSTDHAWGESIPAPVQAPDEVLNFSELLRRCLGKQEFAVEMLCKFRSRAAEQISDLQQLCAANERTKAAMLAHELKGSAATMGAQRLSAAFSEVEAQARRAGGPPLMDCMAQAHQQWLRVAEWLDHGRWRDG